MQEKQISQELELANCIVRSTYSLLTFEASYAYSNMGCCDHVYIIGSVAYRKSCFQWITSSHHYNDVSFLFRTYATCKHYISTFT